MPEPSRCLAPRWRHLDGVVSDVRQHRLQLASEPEMYYLHAQRPSQQMYLRALASLLYEVEPTDPAVFAQVAGEVLRDAG